MAGMNFRNAYEFDPETYRGQGGVELPNRLQALMQQQAQKGADSGSTAHAASEYDPNNYGSPQGGLLGRLLALQAEQKRYQPLSGNGGQAPAVPQTSDNGQAPQTRVTVPFDAYPPYDSESFGGGGGLLGRLLALQREQGGYQPIPGFSGSAPAVAYSPLGANVAARPERSLFDHLQAYWNNPDPHGLVAMLKEARRAAEQAVQGSIDATSTPLTEEEAFRQNLGRELGPIGAFRAASLQAPLSPRATSGLLRFLADLLLSRAASSAVAGINPLSPKSAIPQEQLTGGLPGKTNGNPMPQWPFP